MQINQPTGMKPKKRERKLRSGVNLQGALKVRRRKTRPWCVAYCGCVRVAAGARCNVNMDLMREVSTSVLIPRQFPISRR